MSETTAMTSPDNHSVAIMIGSNTADRHRLIIEASRLVAQMLDNPVMSEISDTPDFTGIGEPYLNRVIKGCVSESQLQSLQHRLHHIESLLGRDRSNPAIVAIDIDLVTSTAPDGTTSIHSPREYRTSLFRSLSASIPS